MQKYLPVKSRYFAEFEEFKFGEEFGELNLPLRNANLLLKKTKFDCAPAVSLSVKHCNRAQTYFLPWNSGTRSPSTAARPTAPAPSTTAFSISMSRRIARAINSSLQHVQRTQPSFLFPSTTRMVNKVVYCLLMPSRLRVLTDTEWLCIICEISSKAACMPLFNVFKFHKS